MLTIMIIVVECIVVNNNNCFVFLVAVGGVLWTKIR